MGYGMYMRKSSFFIPSEKLNDLIKTIKAMPRDDYTYVRDYFKDDNTTEDLFHTWRWDIEFDEEKNINKISFRGENIGDDYELFKTIARFVKKGSFIEMVGDDGDLWQWFFDGNICIEKKPKIKWN